MAKGHQDGITILLGLEGYMVGKVREGDEGIVVEVNSAIGKVNCPHCSSTRIYRHG